MIGKGKGLIFNDKNAYEQMMCLANMSNQNYFYN